MSKYRVQYINVKFNGSVLMSMEIRAWAGRKRNNANVISVDDRIGHGRSDALNKNSKV